MSNLLNYVIKRIRFYKLIELFPVLQCATSESTKITSSTFQPTPLKTDNFFEKPVTHHRINFTI